MSNVILGIDLGTSKSIACAYIGGKPEFIPSSDGFNLYGPSFPSYVAFVDEKNVLVGEPAKRRYVTYPDQVVRAIKKDMGKLITKEYFGRSYTPQEISALILGKIKDDAEKFLNCSVKDVVITVPAYFDDNQRTATKDAARIAGLNVVQLINEPTAACIAHGYDKSGQGNQRILVFDLDMDTLDVTIMDCGTIFEVKAISGDNFLGGNDINNALAEFLAKEFEKQHGVKLDRNNKINNRLIEAAERAEVVLSSDDVTEVNLPFMAMDSFGNPLDLITTITRSKLEELVRPIVERCQKLLQNVLDDSGFAKKDIDKLILVGGSTRMPIVRDFVEDFMGIDAEEGVDSMYCVAQGAALKGAEPFIKITDIIV